MLKQDTEGCKEVAKLLFNKFYKKSLFLSCRKDDCNFLYLAVKNKNKNLVEALCEYGMYDVGKNNFF